MSASLRDAERMSALIRRPAPAAVVWAHDARSIAIAALHAPIPGPSALRRAVGDARRALKSPAELGAALCHAVEAI